MLIRVWGYLWHQILTIHNEQGAAITRKWRIDHTRSCFIPDKIYNDCSDQFSWGHRLQAHRQHHALHNVVYICVQLLKHTLHTLILYVQYITLWWGTSVCNYLQTVYLIFKHQWLKNNKCCCLKIKLQNYGSNKYWCPTSGFQNMRHCSLFLEHHLDLQNNKGIPSVLTVWTLIGKCQFKYSASFKVGKRKKKEQTNTQYNNTLIPLLSPSRSVTIGRYCDIFWFNASGFNFATDFWHILSPKKLIPTVINTQCDLCLID